MDNIEVIKKCIAGDESARNEFCDLYSRLINDSIIRTFKEYGVPINHDITEDLYHDMIVLIFRNDCKVLGDFEGKHGCTLASYIRTISVNKAIDYLRKHRPTLSLDEEEDSEEGKKISNFIQELLSYTDNTVLERDAINTCNKLLSELNREEQNFCQLCFIDSLDPKEIAEQLGISVDNMYVRKQRILNKLKKIAKDKNIC